MRSRGADRPDEGPDERRDPRAKGRRWGRGRAEAEPEEPVAGEEFGWIDDLRSAKQQRGELGPDGVPVEPVPPRAGVPTPPDAPPARAARIPRPPGRAEVSTDPGPARRPRPVVARTPARPPTGRRSSARVSPGRAASPVRRRRAAISRFPPSTRAPPPARVRRRPSARVAVIRPTPLAPDRGAALPPAPGERVRPWGRPARPWVHRPWALRPVPVPRSPRPPAGRRPCRHCAGPTPYRRAVDPRPSRARAGGRSAVTARRPDAVRPNRRGPPVALPASTDP
ncbi:hypothetical protein [Micromonospora sp. CA-246542]|uniref:hypothetical protein n=1 Tax=Micromonospora sp. CA-246542 TaxID=3239959 RepID=UPI003D93B68B